MSSFIFCAIGFVFGCIATIVWTAIDEMEEGGAIESESLGLVNIAASEEDDRGSGRVSDREELIDRVGRGYTISDDRVVYDEKLYDRDELISKIRAAFQQEDARS